ncbi:hypothetical protein MNV49_004131 [Pseudohyphozyma bogoriensis]|nr:hypothetical protein MNV49_004131 [Pseudohyphozyma bogoriensis]
MLSIALQCFLLAHALIHHASALAPTPFTPRFSWSTDYDSTMSIPSCATVTFTYSPNSGYESAVTGPFQVRTFVDGFDWHYYTGAATNTAVSSSMDITLNLAAGTAVSFAMFDNNGYYGGSVGPYTHYNDQLLGVDQQFEPDHPDTNNYKREQLNVHLCFYYVNFFK